MSCCRQQSAACFPRRQARSRCTCLRRAQDGIATIQVTDPVTRRLFANDPALSTYGALATDRLLLLQGAEPATPVGSQAANPIRVRAVAADGVTPVSGATIAWSATNGLQFSACSGASSCSVLSDEAGRIFELGDSHCDRDEHDHDRSGASRRIRRRSRNRRRWWELLPRLDLAALTPTHWVGQGATIAVPLTVEVLRPGVPQGECGYQFRTHQGDGFAFGGQCNHQRRGTRLPSRHNSRIRIPMCR